MRQVSVPFSGSGCHEYERMAEVIGRLKGKAIVSLNEHPDIRRIFAAFDMDTVTISYTVGGGSNAIDGSEVIIYSWDRSSDPVGLF